jgi:hypothetical protein
MAGNGQITSERASSGSYATYRTHMYWRTPQGPLPVCPFPAILFSWGAPSIEGHSAFIQACDVPLGVRMRNQKLRNIRQKQVSG